jgi:hypothetical protein
MILVEDKRGAYMPVYYSNEFEFLNYKTDWNYYLFVFREFSNDYICFVSKSIEEL